MTTPKVSVVVPIYNVAQYIKRCTHSLFAQTFNEIEYIFVDDCTSDDSIELLNQVLLSYPQRKDFVNIFAHERNCGLVAARKTGIAHAKGKYVICFDSDDWMDINMVQLLYDEAERGNYDIVYCNYWEYRNGVYTAVKNVAYQSSILYIENILRGTLGAYLWNKLVKREIYKKVSFNEGYDMWEDLQTSIQLFYYAHSISLLDSEPLYYYNLGNITSISSSRSMKKMNGMIHNILFIESFLAEKNIPNSNTWIYGRKCYCKLHMISGFVSADIWKNTFPELNNALFSRKDVKWYSKMCIWLINKRLYLIYNLVQTLKKIFSSLD
jgi:glycoside transferase family 2 protein